MNLNFKPDEDLLRTLQDEFNTLGVQDAIFMNHYQLALATGREADEWKGFMNHPLVRDFLTEELMMYKDFQIRSMIKNADTLERSVGAAQWINALNKTDLGTMNDGGKIFVYSYVPLNEQERNAPNVDLLSHDIFRLGE